MTQSSKLGLGAVFFLALMAFLVWLLLPSLITDFSSRADTYNLTADEKVVEAKCRTKLTMISLCDIKLVNSKSGETSEFNYLIGGSVGGEFVTPIRFNSGSQALSTSTGLEHLNNRLAMFGGFLLFLLMMLFGLAKGYKEAKAA